MWLGFGSNKDNLLFYKAKQLRIRNIATLTINKHASGIQSLICNIFIFVLLQSEGSHSQDSQTKRQWRMREGLISEPDLETSLL